MLASTRLQFIKAWSVTCILFSKLKGFPSKLTFLNILNWFVYLIYCTPNCVSAYLLANLAYTRQTTGQNFQFIRLYKPAYKIIQLQSRWARQVPPCFLRCSSWLRPSGRTKRTTLNKEELNCTRGIYVWMKRSCSTILYTTVPAIAMSTAVKNCLLSLMSDWMVGKLVAPANANIVVLKADNICSSTVQCCN